jgi:prepilin-type N-terminal cleavage/methylation domain-containing protein
MRRAFRASGFTLVEALVAVALLAVTALAVTQTCLQAQRARRLSAGHMRATLLAAQALEQLRAGHGAQPLTVADGTARAATVAAWNGRKDLQHVEVTVTWNDGAERVLRLSTLMRR